MWILLLGLHIAPSSSLISTLFLFSLPSPPLDPPRREEDGKQELQGSRIKALPLQPLGRSALLHALRFLLSRGCSLPPLLRGHCFPHRLHCGPSKGTTMGHRRGADLALSYGEHYCRQGSTSKCGDDGEDERPESSEEARVMVRAHGSDRLRV